MLFKLDLISLNSYGVDYLLSNLYFWTNKILKN